MTALAPVWTVQHSQVTDTICEPCHGSFSSGHIGEKMQSALDSIQVDHGFGRRTVPLLHHRARGGGGERGKKEGDKQQDGKMVG